jgi:hypothetical protein
VDCLEVNEICEWAERRGLITGNGFSVELPRLRSTYRAVYGQGSRSGLENAAAQELVSRLGPWDECLLWIREWGVWPSGEDWPTFYAWRGVRKERRSIEKAPGHRFKPDERTELVELVTLVMENAWDADLMCSVSGRADVMWAHVSHDEWFEILGMPSGNLSSREHR